MLKIFTGPPVQRVLALVDTGVNYSLLYGNMDRYMPGDLYRWVRSRSVHVWQATLTVGIGRLPEKAYTVYISPIPEYILRMDIFTR